MPRRLPRTLPLAVMAAMLATLLLAGPALAGGYCHDGPMTEGSGTQVSMRNYCFSPTILRVRPGQTVTFVNRDAGIAHPVTGANGSWGLGEATETGAMRFDKAGVYPYFCHTHLGMIGVIVVGDPKAAGFARPVEVSGEPALADAAAAQAAAEPAPAPDQGPGWAVGSALAIAATIGAVGGLLATSVLRRRRAPDHDA
jgi:plastocyanin